MCTVEERMACVLLGCLFIISDTRVSWCIGGDIALTRLF